MNLNGDQIATYLSTRVGQLEKEKAYLLTENVMLKAELDKLNKNKNNKNKESAT